ncbi:MAG: hypothetical protein LLG37_05250, partial [Spirochaetia bacterium]|nr:hypothetical protein [Spirochaetia bacterium]
EKDPAPPTVIAVNGEYMGYMISDSGNRSVLIVNTRTGSFEVHDIDRQGMDRKTQQIYYSAVKYDREKGTRTIVKYDVNEGMINAGGTGQ